MGRSWLSLGPAAVACAVGVDASAFVDDRGRPISPMKVTSAGGAFFQRDVVLPVWSSPPAEGLFEVQWPVARAGYLPQFEHDRSAVIPLGRVVEARQVLDRVSRNLSELDRAVALAGGLAGVDVAGYARGRARRDAEVGGGEGGGDQWAAQGVCGRTFGLWRGVVEAAREELSFIAPGGDEDGDGGRGGGGGVVEFDPAGLGDQNGRISGVCRRWFRLFLC